MKKILAIASAIGLVVLLGVTSFAMGSPRGAATGAAAPSYMRGVIGADYHYDADVAPADWGIDETLRPAAAQPLTDDDVFVVTRTWSSGAPGQTHPTTNDFNPKCDGTLAQPTAPPGKVCIYVAGSDNAYQLNGYSVTPGPAGSRYGFKLGWASRTPGDTFVDAVYAYGRS